MTTSTLNHLVPARMTIRTEAYLGTQAITLPKAHLRFLVSGHTSSVIALMVQECIFKVLASTTSAGGELGTICKLPLDLADYASPEHSEEHVTLQVPFASKQSGKGQPFGQLRLQISSHIPAVSQPAPVSCQRGYCWSHFGASQTSSAVHCMV